MKALLQILILSILTSILFSCKKDTPIEINNSKPHVTSYPVLYSLTPAEKALLEHFSTETLHFIDSANNIIEFKSDGIGFSEEYSPIDAYKGEEMVLYFTCQSDYIKTFKIGYQLYATSDTTGLLNFCNISGYLAEATNYPAYYASSFQLSVNPNPNDSLFGHIPTYSFDIIDTLHLKTGDFYNVYYLKTPSGFGLGILSYYWYFNKDYGIIAFKNTDGRFWSLMTI